MTKLTSTKQSDLEAAFDTQFNRLAPELPKPEVDFKFDPNRKWKIDRVWLPHMVAVEIEGGGHGRRVKCHNCYQYVRAIKGDGSPGREIRIGGWHARRERFLKDTKKYNAMVAQGWILLRYTNEDIIGNPFDMVDQIRGALEKRSCRVKLIEDISKREKEVLYLIAAGFNSAEAAQRLKLSEYSIRGKVQDACEKLCVRSRAAAVARAITWEILDPAEIPWPGEEEDIFTE